MKYRASNWKLAALSIAGVLLAVSLSVSMLRAAQNGGAARSAAESKPTPRAADGHPDLNGYWNTPPPEPGSETHRQSETQTERTADGSLLFEAFLNESDEFRTCISDACQAPNQPPYKPEYMAKVKQIAKTGFGGNKPDDPMNQCRPEGLPRAFGAMQIVQTPKVTAILYESAPYSTYRLIYTDGRSHPPAQDLEATYFGDSVGHWEGDTLVVDVIGFNDDTWLGGDAYRGIAQYTNIHSNKEHVTERWTRKGDALTYETTVEDPVMFTRPWVLAPRHVEFARPIDYLLPTICTPTDPAIIRKQNAEGIKDKEYCSVRCTDETK
jgi:hypothetical protein